MNLEIAAATNPTEIDIVVIAVLVACMIATSVMVFFLFRWIDASEKRDKK